MADDLQSNDDFQINLNDDNTQFFKRNQPQTGRMKVKLCGQNTTHLYCSVSSNDQGPDDDCFELMELLQGGIDGLINLQDWIG